MLLLCFINIYLLHGFFFSKYSQYLTHLKLKQQAKLGISTSMAENKRKILVAVDEGEESAYALKWCFKNLISNHNSNDTIILLYAKTPVHVYSAMDSTGYLFSTSVISTMEKYGNEMAQQVLEKAKHVCKVLNDKVTVETMVEHGDPRDVICEVAEKFKVDILVMGSHGYGLIKRAFLGSVSNYCAQNAKCPVLIVKAPKPKADKSVGVKAEQPLTIGTVFAEASEDKTRRDSHTD